MPTGTLIDVERLMTATGNASGKRLGKDPGDLPGAPPNLGDPIVPHVLTFTGVLGSAAKVYRPNDEALIDSANNARFMRNDVSIMECVEMRQRSWRYSTGR